MQQFYNKAVAFGPIVVVTTASPLQTAEIGAAYSATIGASGGVGPYTFALISGSLPAGLNLATNGVISGTPTTVQVMFPNISATDSLGHQSQPKAFSLTVVSAVSITTTSPLPAGTQSSPYTFTMAASGGVTPYTWSLLSQTGSNGWSVSSAGVVSGTPGTVETDVLNIQVVDALGVPSAANFNLTVSSASGQTFAYYIATTGSDANVGSLASPWAITAINTKQSTYAGQRLGILPGTYDVSGLMYVGAAGGHSTALMINGGPNSSTPTYIGTSNSSGTYQANTAILDAKGTSGFYGGSNTNNSTVIGSAAGNTNGPSTPANWGNWILDGLDIIGFSYWAFQVGSYDASGGLMPNTTIQNCRFYNSTSANAYTGTGGVHSGPLELYQYNGCTVFNCFLYNNVTNTSNDRSHFAALTSWGFSGLGNSTGLTVKQCSFVNTGGFYGINDTGPTSNTTVTQCYFDMTQAAVANGIPSGMACMGFSSSTAGLGTAITFTNNIIKGGGVFDGWNTDSSQIFANNFQISNNTWDLAAGAGYGAASMGFRAIEATGHTALCSAFNNLIYDDGASSVNPYGYWATNPDIFSLCDYNIYGALNLYNVYGTNGGTGGPTSKTFSTWQTAIGNLEAHSSTNSINPFTNAGSFALAYTVTAGPAFQTGKVGGLSSGAAVNVGAWDGIVTQIGSTLALP